jgi:hypothetical protein
MDESMSTQQGPLRPRCEYDQASVVTSRAALLALLSLNSQWSSRILALTVLSESSEKLLLNPM